jgi:cytochrome P450
MREKPLVLDPTAGNRAAEEKELHAAKGPVLVDILGELAWAVADPDLLAELLIDPRVSKDPRQHWPRFIAGEIEGKWPLYLQVSVDNMFTAYGRAHRRLRRLVSSAFSGWRLDVLTPFIKRRVAELLAELAAGPQGPIDLRAAYAVRLPVAVISELLGIPDEMRAHFKRTIDRIWDTTSTPEQALASTADVYAMLEEHLRRKREELGNDLTSALITYRDVDPGGTALTERELVDTLLLVTAAGYQTTVNLIDSAITAMLRDRAQLVLVRSGRATWEDVVEETLRLTAPVSHMPMRYAVEDIGLPDGALIRQGEAILPSYGAASNHPKYQGESAGRFDAIRRDKSHLAFGHGAHSCVGAPLARVMGAVAVGGLFGRFPAPRLAVPPADLEPISSILGNGHVSLPVHLE